MSPLECFGSRRLLACACTGETPVLPGNVIYFVGFAGSLSLLFTSFQSSYGNSLLTSDKNPSLIQVLFLSPFAFSPLPL
jgi:hypothetical protein